MKSVLMSIQPKWCELIARGEKTIEMRKTAPKLQTPFKCYIYDTKGLFDITLCQDLSTKSARIAANGRGKVLGEFVCDRIDKYSADVIACAKFEVNGAEVEEKLRYNAGACLDAEGMYFYSKGKPLYGWHISNLKIYDEPKELGEFSCPCKKGKIDFNADTNCKGCRYAFKGVISGEIYCDRTVQTAPQSWCYVEVQNGKIDKSLR